MPPGVCSSVIYFSLGRPRLHAWTPGLGVPLHETADAAVTATSLDEAPVWDVAETTQGLTKAERTYPPSGGGQGPCLANGKPAVIFSPSPGTLLPLPTPMVFSISWFYTQYVQPSAFLAAGGWHPCSPGAVLKGLGTMSADNSQTDLGHNQCLHPCVCSDVTWPGVCGELAVWFEVWFGLGFPVSHCNPAFCYNLPPRNVFTLLFTNQCAIHTISTHVLRPTIPLKV